MPDVGMPRLSDSMREGAVSEWLVEDGTEVTRGQEILEVETDKATMTYEAEHDGPLRILVPAGVNVEVGHLIATIGDPDPAPPTPAPTPPGNGDGRRADVSPLLRRLAREHGVDIDTLQGSGPDGKVLRADITAASQSPAGDSAGRVALSRSQRLVASRMSESSRTVPDFWASLAVDVTRATELREDLKAAPAGAPGAGPVPTLNDVIVKACALALVRHPGLNAAYDDDHVLYADAVNIGIAVATSTGLLVPVIRSADQRSLTDIAVTSQRLTAQARAGKSTVADLEGGTFTVSNLGGFGVRAFAPIINGHQAAILGVGAATPTCVPMGGAVTVRSMLELTLTCDHRIVYGADAARFLQTLKELLEAPTVLL
jgi:pyruvate dehydrogenase E2 component (dihydrolipoamide acetyltransferase)